MTDKWTRIVITKTNPMFPAKILVSLDNEEPAAAFLAKYSEISTNYSDVRMYVSTGTTINLNAVEHVISDWKNGSYDGHNSNLAMFGLADALRQIVK